jgi:stress-induced morphogen
MAMPGEDIAQMITDAMPGASVEMIDLAGDNDHWKAVIIWNGFAGMPRVRQHQAVYAALKGKMGGELHALALETRAE